MLASFLASETRGSGRRERFPYDGDSDPTKAPVEGVRRLVRHLGAHPAYTRLELRDLERPRGHDLRRSP